MRTIISMVALPCTFATTAWRVKRRFGRARREALGRLIGCCANDTVCTCATAVPFPERKNWVSARAVSPAARPSPSALASGVRPVRAKQALAWWGTSKPSTAWPNRAANAQATHAMSIWRASLAR